MSLAQELLQPERMIAAARWPSAYEVGARFAYAENKIWLGRTLGVDRAPVGISGEGHTLLCAATGGGKGQRILVDNMALWQGSLCVFDPKGTIASMMAVRRGGEWNPYCQPMGQRCYVFDPYDEVEYSDEPDLNAKLKAAYTVSINPLDVAAKQKNPIAILIAFANIICEADTDRYWGDSAKMLLVAIMLLVMKARRYEGAADIDYRLRFASSGGIGFSERA